ncbi:MAG: PAS domain-containing protein [Chloroflexi bacterium]|nr:PAS domain-containing protein [Chloroflexota bacterium]
MSNTPSKQIVPEEEYRNIFEVVSEAIVIYDIENGLVAEANPAACDIKPLVLFGEIHFRGASLCCPLSADSRCL